MNYDKEISNVLSQLLNESTSKIFLKESFKNNLLTVLNTAWQQPGEKQIVKILFTNKDNILKNESKGKEFLNQVFTQNKNLIQNSCSSEFVDCIIQLTGQEITETKSVKYINSNKLNETEMPQQSDNTTVQELVLFATNSGEYYQRDFEPLINKWQKIFKQGNYNERIAFNDFFQATKRVADAYQRQYANATASVFTKPDLIAAAKEIMDGYVEEIKSSYTIHENKMYRYYRVQYMNEAQTYVAVPPFAINTLMEHETVLGFALESKQIKTQKGVDYVIEVSEKEFEEVDTELEGTWGKESKEENPQDASIDSSKNKFDKVKETPKKDGGATQSEGKKLHESKWNFLFEGLIDGCDSSLAKMRKPANTPDSGADGIFEAGDYDIIHGMNSLTLPNDKLTQSETDREGFFDDAFEDDLDADSQEDYQSMNPSQHRLDVENDFKRQSGFKNEADAPVYNDLLGDDSTRHMTRSEKIKKDIDEADEIGTEELEESEWDDVNGESDLSESAAWDKATGKSHYAEDEDMGEDEEGNTLYENDTSDMTINADMPAFQTKEVKKRTENLDVYGVDSDGEYIGDEEVLQEKFIKFVLKNCQGASKYNVKGKFQLKEFLNNKTYGFIKLLENEFKNTLNSLSEDAEEFDIDEFEIKFDRSEIIVKYSYPNDEESRQIEVPEQYFFEFLEETDPNWDDNSEDVEKYWNGLGRAKQNNFVKEFLINKKGVAQKI